MSEAIRTQLDELIYRLKSSGRALSVSSLSSSCSLPHGEVLKWLTVLEKSGQVRIENRINGVHAIWIGGGFSETLSQTEEDIRTVSETQVAASELTIARDLEGKAHPRHARAASAQKEEIVSARQQVEAVKAQLDRVDQMIERLKAKRKGAKQKKPYRSEPEWAPEAVPSPGEEAEEGSALARIVESDIPPQKDFGAAALQPEEAHEDETILSALAELESEQKGYSLPEEGKQEVPPQQEEPSFPQVKMALPRQGKAARGKKLPAIKKPQPVLVPSVSLQFSDKMARQIKKITAQTQEIEKLKMEKEKLLAEHYMPLQRRLESEIETITDRVLRLEKNIVGMQQRVSELPTQITQVEKLNISSIKAHAEMRKAFDEASALIEESARELSEEREKMQLMVEQSRHEIAEHRVKSDELSKTLNHIASMEEEAANAVIAARAALAEQAERLASAESYSQELTSLKSEIKENVDSIKREISSTKGVLTGMEKQMQQMKQVELFASSVLQDYERKMGEVDEYIRNGNQEFDTLRESVEANFVRRYLRELRQLTDSYTFELGQVRSMEGDVDKRLGTEKQKLDELLEEGRKIAYLYETQSREPEGSGDFEKRGEPLSGVKELSEKRTEIEQMIAQIVGNRSETQVASSPIASRAAKTRKKRVRVPKRKLKIKAKPVKRMKKAKKRK